MGPLLQARVDFEVRRAIGRGEPRVIVLQVLVREETQTNKDVVIFVDILYEYNQKANVVTATYTSPAPIGG
jgi:phage baseplate assembly protein W